MLIFLSCKKNTQTSLSTFTSEYLARGLTLKFEEFWKTFAKFTPFILHRFAEFYYTRI